MQVNGQCNPQPGGLSSSGKRSAEKQWKRPPSVSVYDGRTQYLWQGRLRVYVYKRYDDKPVYLGVIELS